MIVSRSSRCRTALPLPQEELGVPQERMQVVTELPASTAQVTRFIYSPRQERLVQLVLSAIRTEQARAFGLVRAAHSDVETSWILTLLLLSMFELFCYMWSLLKYYSDQLELIASSLPLQPLLIGSTQ